MTNRQLAPFFLVLLVIAGLQAAAVFADPPAVTATNRPTWEYKIDGVMDVVFDSHMANLGSQGWELVTARRANGSDGAMMYECIFKRAR